MQQKKVLLVGFGKLAEELAPQLIHDGYKVTGLKRNKLFDHPRDVELIYLDVIDKEQLSSLETDFEHVVITLTPSERTDDGYLNTYYSGTQNLLEHFAIQQSTAKFILVSSTRVYPQNNGEWIDETSSTRGDDSKAAILRQAEELLWQFDPHHIVMRLSGIYGGHRNHLLKRVQQGIEAIKTPPYYTNRIHQTDAVSAIRMMLNKQSSNASLHNLYLVSDDNPAPLWDVANWIAAEHDWPVPVESSLSNTASQNKRCNNSRLKRLGFELTFKDYRAGYKKNDSG